MGWLQRKSLPVQSAAPMPIEVRQAIVVWNCLGGEIHLDDRLLAAMEMAGASDAEQTIHDLMTIRDSQRNGSQS